MVDEIVAKSLAILFSMLFFAQAYCIRLAVGTFIFPAALLSLAWFFFTFIPLVVLLDVPVNPFAILYLFICVCAFSLSALPFRWQHAFNTNRLKRNGVFAEFDSPLMHLLLCLSGLLSIVFSTLSVTSNGFSLKSIIFDLVATSGRYAALRGGGQLEYNYLGILSIFFTYATPIFGGILYQPRQSKFKKLIILFVVFVPSLYFMLTQSQKLVFVLSVGFYFASVLLKKIYINQLNLFNKSFFFKLIGVSLIITPLISISFLSREGFSDFKNNKELLDILAYSFKSYALAEVYAFADFFSNYFGMESSPLSLYVHDGNAFGYYTFTSILNFLCGVKEFPPGIYEGGYFYKDLFSTNVFTIFRGLIYDFGIIGTVVFMFISGFVSHLFFFLLLKSRRSWLACSIFITTVVFIYGTYLMSVFMARYMYLLLIAFVFIFWANGIFSKMKRLKIRNFRIVLKTCDRIS